MESTERDSNELDQPFSQGSLFSDSGSKREKDWYGLRISHRQLIDALEHEYLNPFAPTGISFGLNIYADNASVGGQAFPVFVYVKIDPALLPSQPHPIISPRKKQQLSSAECIDTNQIFIWPYVLPLFCITELAVLEEEHLQRLANVGHMAGNLRLPIVPILRHDIGPEVICQAHFLDSEVVVTMPCQELDAYRGSICMAFWGVPKMHPWIKALCGSLCPKGSASQEADPDLPSWIRLLPWDIRLLSSECDTRTLDEAYWRSAILKLVKSSASEEFRPYEFVDQCADNVKRMMAHNPELLATIESWQKTTTELLKGEASFQVPKDVRQPVSVALQMLLLRPKPEQFKSWIHDYPDLPVAIWFAGLLLCGLLAGYHRLTLPFRGYSESKQATEAAFFNQLLLLFLLDNLDHATPHLQWPHAPKAQPVLREEYHRLNLYWEQHLIGSKRPSEREDWLNADLNDPGLCSSAIELSMQLGWQCTYNSILIPRGSYTFSKKGQIALQNEADIDELLVLGEYAELVGTGDIKVQIQLDREAFRRCLLQNGGDFRLPELKQFHPKSATSSDSYDSKPPNNTLFPTASAVDRISGLRLVQGFLSKQEEEDLLKQLDAETWEFVGEQDSRRVQHYGWRYLYKAKKVSYSDRIGPLPYWAHELAFRLADQGLMPYVPDQVIVNEYIKKQGISMHIDCLPCFHDVIVSISMLEEWSMKFQKEKQHELLSLPRRSALIISGAARSEWKHGIMARIKDPSGHTRGRRISLTFRKVRTPS